MLQRAVARYGLSTSLSLLAAVPFVVGIFAGPHAASLSALWLSLVALEWLLVQPSLRSGEGFRDARRRVVHDTLRDPLFWFALAAAVFAGFRALNGGIRLDYDLESQAWCVTEPWTVGLPASVDGSGLPFFAMALSMLVIVPGLRHGLGKSARAMCLLLASLVAGGAGIAVCVAVCTGSESFLKLAGTGLFSPTWAGDAFCFWLVASSAALGEVEERGWKKAGLPAVFFALAGNAAGAVFLCPPIVAAGAFLASAVVAVLSVNYSGFHAGLVAAARAVVVFSLAVALPLIALSGLADEDLAKEKFAGLIPSNAITERQQTMRAALVDNAFSMWKESPWLGKGLGAYAVNAPFCAEKDDWANLPVKIEFVPNGYAQMLAERGIVGCLVVLIGIVLLVGSGVMRFVLGFKAVADDSDSPAPFLSVPPVAWAQLPLLAFAGTLCLFAASPVLQAQSWAAFVFILAMASASFPVRRRPMSAVGFNTEK